MLTSVGAVRVSRGLLVGAADEGTWQRAAHRGRGAVVIHLMGDWKVGGHANEVRGCDVDVVTDNTKRVIGGRGAEGVGVARGVWVVWYGACGVVFGGVWWLVGWFGGVFLQGAVWGGGSRGRVFWVGRGYRLLPDGFYLGVGARMFQVGLRRWRCGWLGEGWMCGVSGRQQGGVGGVDRVGGGCRGWSGLGWLSGGDVGWFGGVEGVGVGGFASRLWWGVGGRGLEPRAV